MALLSLAVLGTACVPSKKGADAGGATPDGARDQSAVADGTGTGGTGGADTAVAADAGADTWVPDAAIGFVAEVESFCRSAAERSCVVSPSYQTVTQCLAAHEAACTVRYLRFTQSEAAGRFSLDRAAVQRCLDALGPQSDVVVGQPLECQHLFAGTVADDQACLNSNECVSGACIRPDAETCPGICARGGKLGDACNVVGGARCDPNVAYCDATRRCVAILADNSICDPKIDRCVSGDFCDSSADPICRPGGGGCRCRPLRAAGVACDSTNPSNQCRRGLQCVGGACGPPVPRGGRCDQIQGPFCAGDLACVRPVASADAGFEGTCGVRLPAGSKCVDLECQAEAMCDPDNADAGLPGGTCRTVPAPPPPPPPAANGQPCVRPEDCASRICIARVCARDCTLADLK